MASTWLGIWIHFSHGCLPTPVIDIDLDLWMGSLYLLMLLCNSKFTWRRSASFLHSTLHGNKH